MNGVQKQEMCPALRRDKREQEGLGPVSRGTRGGANRNTDVRIMARLAQKGTQHPSFRSRLFLVRTLLLFAGHPKRLSRRVARQPEKVTLRRVRLSWETKT
jgi:hypothetical protein